MVVDFQKKRTLLTLTSSRRRKPPADAVVVKETEDGFAHGTYEFYELAEAIKHAVTVSNFNTNIWVQTLTGSYLIAVA